MSNDRLLDFRTQEELADFLNEFNQRLANQGLHLDKETEDWLDSEFHRIFITYAYADVTSVN
jgi:hypothetical protein